MQFRVGQLVELTNQPPNYGRTLDGTLARVEHVPAQYRDAVIVELYRRHRRTRRALALKSQLVSVDQLIPVDSVTPEQTELLAQVSLLKAEQVARRAAMKADRLAWEKRILAMAAQPQAGKEDGATERPEAQQSTVQKGVRMGESTFAQGRARILEGLRHAGWETRPHLDVPRAISPDGNVSLWFKPQSVYYAVGRKVSLSDAHSLLVDIRRETADGFLQWLEAFLKRRGVQSETPRSTEKPEPEPKAPTVIKPSPLDALLTQDPRLPQEELRFRIAMLAMRAPRHSEWIAQQRPEDIQRSWVDLLASTPSRTLAEWRQKHEPLRAAAEKRFADQVTQEQRGREFFGKFLADLRGHIATLPSDWYKTETARNNLSGWIRDRLYSDQSMIPLGRRKRISEATFARLWRSAQFGDGPQLVGRTLARGYATTPKAPEPSAATVAEVSGIISKMVLSPTLNAPNERAMWLRKLESQLDQTLSTGRARQLAEELALLATLTVQGGYE